MKALIPEIDLEKCNGCGDCIAQCPGSAVSLVSGKAAVVNPQDCDYCADCETLCPASAIRCPFEIILAENKSERNDDGGE